MTGPRDGLARSVQVRLAQHARAIGVDPNLVLTRYVVERYLYRLSCSPYVDQFVLKGGLLLLAWLGETLRPTRDADLLGFGNLSGDAIAGIFRDICLVLVVPDAATFLPDSVRVAPIRQDDIYGGQRATLQARVGAARLTVQVDIGVGDAVTPEPQWLDYPSMLDELPRPRLRAYPRETVVAEKLHAMVVLGLRNSRMKDYFDVYALQREAEMDTAQLARAIATTFARRQTALPEAIPMALSNQFANDQTKQAQWQAFLARSHVKAPELQVVVLEVRARLAATLDQARKVSE